MNRESGEQEREREEKGERDVHKCLQDHSQNQQDMLRPPRTAAAVDLLCLAHRVYLCIIN